MSARRTEVFFGFRCRGKYLPILPQRPEDDCRELAVVAAKPLRL